MVSERLSALAGELRSRGVRVGVGELLAAHRALDAVDASSRQDAYHALRAALCSSHTDVEAFRAAFVAVFGVAGEPLRDPLGDLGEIVKAALPRAGVPTPGAGPPDRVERAPVPAAHSAEELLRTKDFAEYTDAERAAARRLLARIARRSPQRLSRRTRPSRRRRDVHDLRATVRVSLRHGGELVERRYREPAERPRRLVLVCDVSGSMAPYARMLLQYVQACVAAQARVEAFAFGTRLTRVTRELAGRDPDRALERAAAAADDWSGGTRIGAAIGELNREHGRRIGRGALGRMGPRGARAARGRDGAPAPLRAPRRLAEPARGRPALRAADPRHARGAAARRPPAAGQLDRLAGAAGRSDGGRHRDVRDAIADLHVWTARGGAASGRIDGVGV
jgi:uncharacterized protein